MATLYGLQEKLKELRKSLIGAKGGLEKGRPGAHNTSGTDWIDYTQEKLDEIREKINDLIEYVDKIIGY